MFDYDLWCVTWCNATQYNTIVEAQALGFAEADPTADVEGHDVQAKIALLAKLAFGWVSEWVGRGVSEWMSEWVSEGVRIGVCEWMSVEVRVGVSVGVNEWLIEWVRVGVSEWVSERVRIG